MNIHAALALTYMTHAPKALMSKPQSLPNRNKSLGLLSLHNIPASMLRGTLKDVGTPSQTDSVHVQDCELYRLCSSFGDVAEFSVLCPSTSLSAVFLSDHDAPTTTTTTNSNSGGQGGAAEPHHHRIESCNNNNVTAEGEVVEHRAAAESQRSDPPHNHPSVTTTTTGLRVVVRYSAAADAEHALFNLHGMVMDGSVISARWA